MFLKLHARIFKQRRKHLRKLTRGRVETRDDGRRQCREENSEPSTAATEEDRRASGYQEPARVSWRVAWNRGSGNACKEEGVCGPHPAPLKGLRKTECLPKEGG